LALLPLAAGETAELTLEPGRQWDLGAGPGQALSASVRGGVVGLVLDARGRPIQLADDDRLGQVSAWQRALNLYGE
jgi:hypothetical protein